MQPHGPAVSSGPPSPGSDSDPHAAMQVTVGGGSTSHAISPTVRIVHQGRQPAQSRQPGPASWSPSLRPGLAADAAQAGAAPGTSLTLTRRAFEALDLLSQSHYASPVTWFCSPIRRVLTSTASWISISTAFENAHTNSEEKNTCSKNVL